MSRGGNKKLRHYKRWQEKRVERMRLRWENGLDIWTGNPLSISVLIQSENHNIAEIRRRRCVS